MRKFALASLAGAVLIWTSSAHSAAYFIAGQWYYFSLDFKAQIAKITGKDLNDGTFVGTEVKIYSSDTACLNPQTKKVNPGVGPTGLAYGFSPTLTPEDLDKSDRQKRNIFTTTAVSQLVHEDDRLKTDLGLCKDAVGIPSQWYQLYWQDRNCNYDAATPPVCYKEFAAPSTTADNLVTALRYVTGPDTTKDVTTSGNIPATLLSDWTFVYLPTAFKFKAYLDSGTSDPYSAIYGKCEVPKSYKNVGTPPADGWGGLQYKCDLTLTEADYNALTF